ncbi:integrase arm-type DNA-binding domain-containing protein [Lonepinella sp. BR2919]|uniref:DNA primase family protein n=1 Tax=unclassified Lonepinella TaxID=2642006 RepID=UPI003F6DC2C5
MARLTKPLTNTEVINTKPKDKNYKLSDGGGLFLLIKNNGVKNWRMRYKRPITKKENEVSLGNFPEVSLQQARKQRDEFLALLAENIDPLEYRKEQELAEIRKAENTFKIICSKWFNLDSNSTTEKQKTDAFFKWRNQPLGRDLTLSKSFIYNGKAWLDYSDEELKRDIVKFYNEHNASYRNSTINNLAEIIILNMATAPQANGRFIAFENGVIDKFTGDFLEHNQQQGVRGLEPYSVTLSEDTPHFDSWLKFVANGDEEKEQAIMAGLYMILTNRHKWQLFLELVGTAGAGKSILSGIAETVNGKGNTASMKIEQLIDPINIATLIDKSLLLSPEQGEYSKGAEDLKRITGGDLTRAKIHYQMPIDIVLQLVVVLITNTPLYFPDLNGGIARRRVIIHFDRKVPEDKKDVNFLDKVKLEVYGIIKLLLKAFPEPETARTILETYRENHKGLATKIQADHLIDFAQEFYIKPVEPTDPPNERNDKINGLYWGSNKGIKDFHTALYRAYIHFCECTNQRKVMSLSIFKQRLPDALKEAGQKGEVVERLKDNTLVTNIYYKDKMLTLAKWQG